MTRIILLIITLIVVMSVYIGVLISLKPKIEAHNQNDLLYQIVLKCQELSSQATNEDWGYDSCVKQLKQAAGGDKFDGVLRFNSYG